MISKLNKVLADELVGMRWLHRAKSQCHDGGQCELLDRILLSCAEICAILEETIRRLGGAPVRSQPKPTEEGPQQVSLRDCLQTTESIQRDIIKEINSIVESPALADVHDALLAIRQFHLDNAHWLTEALGAEEQNAAPKPRT
ncbi:MAG TPA: DUF6306 domain-containing protein [Verrucomicrobiae bacterium]|nr:DUF6306 domain-containing protein [Verrucomicrobiae bacterium]